MNSDRAVEVAKNKVVEMLKDIGIKIRPREICRTCSEYSREGYKEAQIHFSADKDGGVKEVKITLYFSDFGERGKNLRKRKTDFLITLMLECLITGLFLHSILRSWKSKL